jgi:hypothetical protein
MDSRGDLLTIDPQPTTRSQRWYSQANVLLGLILIVVGIGSVLAQEGFAFYRGVGPHTFLGAGPVSGTVLVKPLDTDRRWILRDCNVKTQPPLVMFTRPLRIDSVLFCPDPYFGGDPQRPHGRVFRNAQTAKAMNELSQGLALPDEIKWSLSECPIGAVWVPMFLVQVQGKYLAVDLPMSTVLPRGTCINTLHPAIAGVYDVWRTTQR